MTQAAQEISITYGSFTIDDANKANYLILDNAWHIAYSDVKATVSFKVLVKGTSESDFFTKEGLFREAFRDIRKLLTIALSGSTYYSFTVSGTPHADSKPRLNRLDDEHFTNLTCAYSVEIDVVMAAITTRREENVVISKDSSSIRTLTITATYNATSSLGAYQSYQADFDTFCASVITFIDAREGAATWEQVLNPNLTTNTVVNNVVVITRIYKELIFSQSESTLDDTELVGLSFNIDFDTNRPGDAIPSQISGGVLLNRAPLRPTEAIVLIRTNVPKSVTDLETVYTNKIKPYILNHARDRGGFSAMAVHGEKVAYDRVNNLITATFNITGATEGYGQVLSSSGRVNIKNEFGNLLVGAHDGTPYGRYVVPVKANKTKTVMEMVISISSSSIDGGSGGSGSGGGNVGFLDGPSSPFGGGSGQIDVGRGNLVFGPDPGEFGGFGTGGPNPDGSPNEGTGGSGGGGGGGGRWVYMSDELDQSPKVIGTVSISDQNFSIMESTFTRNYTWVTNPVQGVGGGGTGQSVVPSGGNSSGIGVTPT